MTSCEKSYVNVVISFCPFSLDGRGRSWRTPTCSWGTSGKVQKTELVQGGILSFKFIKAINFLSLDVQEYIGPLHSPS